MSKVALITGVTVQEETYLADILSARENTVHDVKRGSSLITGSQSENLKKITQQ
jgi:GDP-D-mannose dehydratase